MRSFRRRQPPHPKQAKVTAALNQSQVFPINERTKIRRMKRRNRPQKIKTRRSFPATHTVCLRQTSHGSISKILERESNERSRCRYNAVGMVRASRSMRTGCPRSQHHRANFLRRLVLLVLKTTAQLAGQLTHLRFFHDVEVGSGNFVHFNAAAGQGAPAFYEID